MARKATVDKDIILNMLREGKTTQHIADEFGVSRQAIDLHRKDFINRGLLQDQRAGRTKRAREESPPPRHETVTPEEAVLPEPNIISLDEQIELIIKAFSALKRLPQLETELEIYKRKYEDAQQAIEHLKGADLKRQEQERRWLLVQSKKDLSAPSEESDKASED